MAKLSRCADVFIHGCWFGCRINNIDIFIIFKHSDDIVYVFDIVGFFVRNFHHKILV
ncbi:hypothetical protein D3C75_1148370 [compost metagenome]